MATRRLRQVALVAADLDGAIDALTSTFSIEKCFRDPGIIEFGLDNALMAIGDTFLEVVSPVQDGTTAGRYLDRRGGDGGYMAIFQDDDLAELRSRVADAGIRVVWQHDFDDIAGTHLHPRDVPGAIVSLDWANPAESWRWAGPVWTEHVATSVVDLISAVDVQSERPDELASIWGRALGIEPSDRVIRVNDDQQVRFVLPSDDRGEGISAVELRATDRRRAGETHDLVGVRFSLV